MLYFLLIHMNQVPYHVQIMQEKVSCMDQIAYDGVIHQVVGCAMACIEYIAYNPLLHSASDKHHNKVIMIISILLF